jgi:ribosome maturation factor RimP
MAAQRTRGAAPVGAASGGARSSRPAPAGAGPSRGDLAVHRARLRAVIEPVVVKSGFDLEDVSVSRAGRRHLVRVIIDGDGGVNLDEIAEVSRDVSAAIDAAEDAGGGFATGALDGPYQLEVSSPGVDRPLTQPRHWRRNVGRLVTVKAAERTLTGRVTAVDAQAVSLDVAGRVQQVPFDQLGPGRVQLEFTRLAELSEDEFGEEISDEPGDDEEVDEQ